MSKIEEKDITEIYNDGTYIENNKTLHSEDSEYKFGYIKKLLDEIDVDEKKIKILDIGGGAGVIGRLVCEYFLSKDKEIEFYALDLSKEMLKVQSQNNPHILKLIDQDIMDLDMKDFDLILMIDVIEHIPEYEKIAKRLNDISKYVIYNIPLEVNLFDKLRNIYFKGQYYKWQTESIGHIHFFSYLGALNFLKKFYTPIKWYFPDYSSHILSTDSEEYIKQRSNRLRNLEFKISRFIYKYFKFIAQFIIQGSLFALVKSK